MDAAIDVGNTNIKVGLFSKDRLERSLTFPTQPISNIYRQLSSISWDNCILSSVVPLPEHITHYIRSKSKKYVALDHQTPLPVQLRYDTPETLGRDRIALAVGAAEVAPGKDLLIISLGSCITYNVLTRQLQFAGGAISPGLHMRLRAMHEFTGALPSVEIESNEKPAVVAQSTRASLLSGAVNGAIFEIEGFIQRVREEYPGAEVLLSGGDSRYVKELLPINTRLEPELGLYGLYKILLLNVKKSA